MAFKLTTYLKSISETFAEFKTEGDHYARVSSITELDEVLQKLRNLKGFIILPVTSHDGNMGDRGHDIFRDEPNHRFYLLKKVKLGDIDERENALDACKELAKKIIFKMQSDKRNGKNGLQFVDLSRIHYITVGPIADNYHGLEFFVDTVSKLWETVPELTAEEDF